MSMRHLPDSRKNRPSLLPVLLLALAGLGAAVAVERLSSEAMARMARERATAAFVDEARTRISAVEERLRRAADGLYSFRSLFRSSDAVDQREFLTFAEETLQRHPEIAALEWTPRVDSSRRSEFERSMRSRYPEFRIHRLSERFRFSGTTRRDAYYPIVFLAPIRGNEQLIGFDLATEPERRKALESAQQRKDLAVSGRIELLPNQPGRYGIFLALPVFANEYRHAWVSAEQDQVVGYLGQVLHVGELVTQALIGLEPSEIDLWLQDLTGSPYDRFLFRYEGSAGAGRWLEQNAPPDQPLVLQRQFRIADRQWRFTATSRTLPGTGAPWLPEVLFGGTLLLAFTSAAWLHQRRKSTYRLAATARELESEVVQRQHTEARLYRLNRAHSVLSACNKALVHAAPDTDIQDLFCRNIVRHGGYPLAWSGTRDSGGRLIPHAVAGSGNPDKSLSGPLASTRGPEWKSLTTSEQLLVAEANRWPDEEWRQAMAKAGLSAVLALPWSGDKAGVLAIYGREAGTFDADERQLLADLAEDLAYALRAQRATWREQQTAEALRLRERAVEASHSGIAIIGNQPPEYPIRYVNPALAELTGRRVDALVGQSAWLLLHPDNVQEREKITSMLQKGRAGELLIRNQRPDGSEYWTEVSVSPVAGDGESLQHFVWAFNDVTEYRHYETQLEHQANYDALSGLPNRNLLLDRLEQAIGYGRRNGRNVVVLFIDLDDFKLINDSLGHRQGDRTLIAIAERLRGVVSAGETLARYGGDEFVIVLPDLDDSAQATEMASRVVNAVSQPLSLGDHTFQLSCSIGISVFPKDGEDPDDLMRSADTAMFKAKEVGRNAWHFYTAELNARVLERVTVEAQLRTALAQNELLLEYQPQVDLHTGEVTGMEALVRWQHPEAGLIYPAQFIPVAEASGLVVPLGEWVMEEACRQVADWRRQGVPVPLVAVNVSVYQFEAPDFVSRLGELLARYAIDPSCFELELTESGLMQHVEHVAHVLQRLKALGVQVSIDDFGTGYSSLAKLQRFAFDKLKVDESFVRNLTTSSDDATISNAIIAMGRSLRLRVLAEGVTSKEQALYLRAHQCDEMQGFYFSEPLRPVAMAALLREGRRLQL